MLGRCIYIRCLNWIILHYLSHLTNWIKIEYYDMTQGIIDWRYGEASLQHASTHGLINNKNYQRYLFLLTVVLTPMWVKENTSWWPLVIRKTFKSYFYFSVLWSMWVLRYISVEMLKITWRLLNFLPEHQLFDKPPKILDLSKQTDSSLEPNFRDGNGINGNLFNVNQRW